MDDKKLKDYACELLRKLTLEEKIGMIHGVQLFETAGVERLGIPPLKMSDGPMGVRQEFLPSQWIPAGHNADFVTYLPCNSAIAASWNREAAYEMGNVLGEEARGRGKDVILGPGVNIKRSPLCGRNFEYYSEDPYLTGELAAAYIRGVQLWDVAACVKHFAANNQETERLWVDVEIDEDSLREIYFPAFYDAVKKGGVHTVMGAYNKVYGEHCCQSEYLLNQVLRKEWGFDGVIISDWGGVHDTAIAAHSQLDIEMSIENNFNDYFMAQPLLDKIKSGEISEDVVDGKVERILVLMQKLHMLGDDVQRKTGAYNTQEHRQKALETARESIILLKNENQILPLRAEQQKRILVIGDNAQRLHADGGGSAEIKALYEISPLMGLKSCLGGNVQVDFAQGYCSTEEETGPQRQDTNWQENSLENGGGIQQKQEENAALEDKRKKLREEAVRLAAEYDTVIYVGGLDHTIDCEGRDRADMKLPYGQDALIRQLLEVKEDLIIVMLAGSPVEMGNWIGKAKAVVWSYYAGMEGGHALADVLIGNINPSGKLPETFYKTLDGCSAHAVGEFGTTQNVAYREGSYVGYRYNDKYEVESEFCFGHGLSYTTFAYTDARLDTGSHAVCCTVENTGAYDGSEVVQVYVHRQGSKFVRELTGFEKVFVKAGQKVSVSVVLGQVDTDAEYYIGSSSRDIRAVLAG